MNLIGFVWFQYSSCNGSTTVSRAANNPIGKFQYSSCNGSTKCLILLAQVLYSFNTAPVTVLRLPVFTGIKTLNKFQYSSCNGSTESFTYNKRTVNYVSIQLL